jgi:NADH-quinone oxidoreductase subunit F
MRFSSLNDLSDYKTSLSHKAPPDRTLWVCGGPGCLASGSLKVYEALLKERDKLKEDLKIKLKTEITGCLGLCERGPLVEVSPEGYFYERVKEEDAGEIALTTLVKGKLVERLCPDPLYPKKETLPFYKPQLRLIMDRFGKCSPESLDDYLRTGGYEALSLSLGTLGPDETARRVEESGLRGRGGGGFPTGLKWKAMRNSIGFPRYVLANGDEGDPGAFMNRSLMEGDPFSIIEGLTIGAFALGANIGFIYVRHEYPLSVERLSKAIEKALTGGFLGNNILGSGFDFSLSIVEGGGAFVCGESTALMASIEGREGTPRVKYVRSTEAGLWEKPTVLQNVETWANIPHIVLKGPEWFRSIGSPDNPGTKIFSLVGQVKRTGLVELPLGTNVGTLIDAAGGGVGKGRKFKAIQSGGPSGGCLPESAKSLPLDFDNLSRAGAMMGSGGLIVMDDLSCMVDVAKYFTGFLSEESCGKCAPCREALPLFHKILTDLSEGRGRKGDTDFLEKEARLLKQTALCGLGQSAANPILSTIKYFKAEYLEHEEGHCRSGRCKGLFFPKVTSKTCRACGACQKVCPASAIEGEKKEPRKVLKEKCISCGSCLKACLFEAMGVERRDYHHGA